MPRRSQTFIWNMVSKTVIVKLGNRRLLQDKRRCTGHSPGITRKKIVDTVGAGDAFAAGV
ncbi:MAG: PfkB family carbohydrate kinase [Blautia faecis]